MTLKEKIQKYFRRKAATPTPQQKGQGVEPVPLRIEGTKPAPLTPEPDDAELAAQALLESMCDGRSKMEDVREVAADAHQPSVRDAAYYRRLAERIRLARDQATLRTMRFVTWCEHELEKRDLPIEGKGSLAQMEAELYKRIDTIERVGGELKHRWQHCLANVIVRRMGEEREATEDGRRKMEDEESSESRESPAETPSQNPTEGRTTNPTEGRLAMPTEGRPADTTLDTSSQTVLPVTEAAINQP